MGLVEYAYNVIFAHDACIQSHLMQWFTYMSMHNVCLHGHMHILAYMAFIAHDACLHGHGDDAHAFIHGHIYDACGNVYSCIQGLIYNECVHVWSHNDASARIYGYTYLVSFITIRGFCFVSHIVLQQLCNWLQHLFTEMSTNV